MMRFLRDFPRCCFHSEGFVGPIGMGDWPLRRTSSGVITAPEDRRAGRSTWRTGPRGGAHFMAKGFVHFLKERRVL
jgi:hypothetical protein